LKGKGGKNCFRLKRGQNWLMLFGKNVLGLCRARDAHEGATLGKGLRKWEPRSHEMAG